MKKVEEMTDEELCDEAMRAVDSLPGLIGGLEEKARRARSRGDVVAAVEIEVRLREFFGGLRRAGLLRPDPFDVKV